MLSVSLLLVSLALGFQAPARIDPQLKPGPKSDDVRADLRVDVPLVLIPVHVTDSLGRLVTGLEKKDFRLFEDGVEQRISHFSTEDSALSIGLLVDASGSMRNKMRKSMATLKTFFQTANTEDEFFLIEFGDRPRLLSPFTQDLNEIRSRLARVKPFGRTALLDAIHMALAEMKSARRSRKVILILSDGGDNRSRYTESEIKGLVRENDAQIYSMGIFDPEDSPRRTAEERNGPRLLSQLAEESGGRHLAVKKVDDLPEICARISMEFRSQYLLGYSPAEGARDARYRNVRVLLASPGSGPPLKLTHRTGYYAPAR